MAEVVHDLFGEVPPSPPKVSNAGQAHGYAASPGTGPKGETCGSCAHLYRKRMGKTYLKCALMSATWTGGHGTDVLSRSPACMKWVTKEYTPTEVAQILCDNSPRCDDGGCTHTSISAQEKT